MNYFDSEDSEEARYAKKQSLNTLRTQEYRKDEYSRGGGWKEIMSLKRVLSFSLCILVLSGLVGCRENRNYRQIGN